MKTFKHVVTTTYEVEVRDTPIDELVAIRLVYNGEQKDLSFGIKRDHWESLVKRCDESELYKTTRNIGDMDKWYLINPSEFWPKYREDSLRHKEQDVVCCDMFLSLDHGHFDTDRLYQIINMSYATKWGDEHPVSPGIQVRYSVEEDYFDLDKAQKILEADERVWDVEREEVVYYDCCEPPTERLKFFVRLAQDDFNELVDLLRERARNPEENLWWLDVDHAFGCQEGLFVPAEFDPLGLRPARKERDEHED